MDKQLIQRLNALLRPALGVLGYELLGCQLLSQGSQRLLRVYIDSEEGVTMDACQAASRQIGAVLDVENPIVGRYVLEVSSPGADRPLFTLAHFERYIGRRVKLRLHHARQNRRHFTGLLTAVKQSEIVMSIDDKVYTLPFDDIDKANLIEEL